MKDCIYCQGTGITEDAIGPCPCPDDSHPHNPNVCVRCEKMVEDHFVGGFENAGFTGGSPVRDHHYCTAADDSPEFCGDWRVVREEALRARQDARLKNSVPAAGDAKLNRKALRSFHVNIPVSVFPSDARANTFATETVLQFTIEAANASDAAAKLARALTDAVTSCSPGTLQPQTES